MAKPTAVPFPPAGGTVIGTGVALVALALVLASPSALGCHAPRPSRPTRSVSGGLGRAGGSSHGPCHGDGGGRMRCCVPPACAHAQQTERHCWGKEK